MNDSSSPSANSTERVVVAMSGGVDSSVAAALLVEQGYDVVGIMMRLWSEPNKGGVPSANRCCSPDQMADARRVARLLDIPFYVLDVQDHFRKTIVQFFIDQHALGRTPNPCIECNRQIRFSYLLNHAVALGANYLATGHYARVQRTEHGYQLRMGVDKNKDQSYVLHVLGQKQLAQTLFPVGGYTKTEVRDLARGFELPLASKGESQDLCFLGDGDYRRFLRDYDARASNAGPIQDSNGQQLGQHKGLSFYTIGQRKGLGISAKEPLFVLRKDFARNALIVGTRDELGRRDMVVRNVNWISGYAPDPAARFQVKIRYKARPVQASIVVMEADRVELRFHEPVMGVTPGQGAVFYDGELCLGGGIISDEPEQATAGKRAPTIGVVI